MIHCYKLGGFNIALDVGSGSVYMLDDLAFDLISMYELVPQDKMIRRIKRKYPDITDAELTDTIADIEELRKNGKLFSEDTYVEATGVLREKSLKALCLNVSHACNMSCSYCFAGNGKYGGEGELMSLETGKRAIDFLVENSGGRKNLDLDFFGGEPLLNWSVVKDIVRYAREIEQGSGKRFRFTLTTNGLLIDDEVIEFTNKEMRNVVLSLDGRQEINDAARKMFDGAGSYSSVVPKFKKLVMARGEREYYIRGTFTRANLDFAEDILHVADLGFKRLSMEPVVAKPGDPHGLKIDDLSAISRQYEILATEMLRREKEGRGFIFYHYMLDLERGPCIHKRLSGCGVGKEYLAVTPRGELYPCHQFVGDGRFLIGDVWQGVKNEKLRREFETCGIYACAECRECWARMYCSGGCAANAYNASGSINGVYELGCEMFKKRMECAIMMKVAKY
ncbi:MAG: thioether cross-link-forming SCIFF peptide maturase [Oscillospiraceae bacterium]|nr:thioether cross-link-forming SCIFF peptide maturase [Oscillospiraceae bacterium]